MGGDTDSADTDLSNIGTSNTNQSSGSNSIERYYDLGSISAGDTYIKSSHSLNDPRGDYYSDRHCIIDCWTKPTSYTTDSANTYQVIEEITSVPFTTSSSYVEEDVYAYLDTFFANFRRRLEFSNIDFGSNTFTYVLYLKNSNHTISFIVKNITSSCEIYFEKITERLTGMAEMNGHYVYWDEGEQPRYTGIATPLISTYRNAVNITATK